MAPALGTSCRGVELVRSPPVSAIAGPRWRYFACLLAIASSTLSPSLCHRKGAVLASFASGARSAITSMARTGCCGLRRRSSKGTSRRGRYCCRGVFESWHISDGNYPPLRVGDLVNLSLSSSRRRWTAWMTASLPSNVSTPATIASLQEYCVYGATVRTRSRSLIPRASRFRG
jgi:hypothetical protein